MTTIKTIPCDKSITTTSYMGIEITKTWFSSNFIGTVRHHAYLPDGRYISSPIRAHVTKRIKKYFKNNN
jgi:hypothetical protein